MDKIDQYGIDLGKLSIVVGEIAGWEYAHGVYEKDGTWIYFEADERNHIYETPWGSEDEAFDKLMRYVFVDLDTERYLTKCIDEHIAKIPKTEICSFIGERQAEKVWACLKQDMRILFEFKYYTVYGTFVPSKYCYTVRHVSAEQLYHALHIDIVSAFCCLVDLSLSPKKTLADLKAEIESRKGKTSDEKT